MSTILICQNERNSEWLTFRERNRRVPCFCGPCRDWYLTRRRRDRESRLCATERLTKHAFVALSTHAKVVFSLAAAKLMQSFSRTCLLCCCRWSLNVVSLVRDSAEQPAVFPWPTFGSCH